MFSKHIRCTRLHTSGESTDIKNSKGSVHLNIRLYLTGALVSTKGKLKNSNSPGIDTLHQIYTPHHDTSQQQEYQCKYITIITNIKRLNI
jgi:hypothetical protein